MKGHEWIWIVVLFGIGVGFWLLVKRADSFTKKIKPQREIKVNSTMQHGLAHVVFQELPVPATPYNAELRRTTQS